ncbi:hypothetical protein EJB05_27949, partial [Eragrostis curvula]
MYILHTETKEKLRVILRSLNHLASTIHAKSYSSLMSSNKPLLPKTQLCIIWSYGIETLLYCFEVIISIRPGNSPLPEDHGFRTIKSFSEI